MKTATVFEFDKIITIRPAEPAKNDCQACYGTLPRAVFKEGVLHSLRHYRASCSHIILFSKENERVTKESLWLLCACELFDEIIIKEERDPGEFLNVEKKYFPFGFTVRVKNADCKGNLRDSSE